MTAPILQFAEINLQSERDAILFHYKKAALELAEIGKRLTSLKKRMDNAKEFKAFLASLPFSERSSYHFMQLHEHVLKHGSATVATENICIAAWYIAPPENEALVNAIIEKSKTEKVTAQDVRALLSTVTITDDRLSLALHTAAQENPAFVIGMVAKGALDTVDGLTISLDDISPQDLSLAWEKDKHERQMLHITENSSTVQRSLDLASNEALSAIYDYSSAGSRKRANDFRIVWREPKGNK
jgi:hypothetical protein